MPKINEITAWILNLIFSYHFIFDRYFHIYFSFSAIFLFYFCFRLHVQCIDLFVVEWFLFSLNLSSSSSLLCSNVTFILYSLSNRVPLTRKKITISTSIYLIRSVYICRFYMHCFLFQYWIVSLLFHLTIIDIRRWW